MRGFEQYAWVIFAQMYWMKWQNVFSNLWTLCPACRHGQNNRTWTQLIKLSSNKECSYVVYLFVKSLQKQEYPTNSITTFVQQRGVYQWSLSFNRGTACLQYLHSSFPEALHPGDDSGQKPLDQPSCDIIYIIHIHKSMHTNILWDTQVFIKPWTQKNTLVELVIEEQGRKIHKTHIRSAFHRLDNISAMLKASMCITSPSLEDLRS